MRIALMGTRGVPAQYGGFETAAEEIGARLATRGHEVFVYCRNKGQRERWYRGMRLVNLPAPRRRELETLGHSLLSAADALRRNFDCVVLFNAANAPVIPLLRAPIAVHIDGLEWRRDKWSGRAKAYLRWAERQAVTRADRVIADARGIQDYVRDRYGLTADFIPYGAPILTDAARHGRLPEGVESRAFHLVVARFEPENSIGLILEGYAESGARHPLLLVGDSPYASEYREECYRRAQRTKNVISVGSIWDQDLLNACYAQSLTYIHGHTVGGTNPSLLRAMGAGAAVIARDGPFNREVAGDAAEYFSNSSELAELILAAERNPVEAEVRGQRLMTRATDQYRWDAVADDYERLCAEIVEG